MAPGQGDLARLPEAGRKTSDHDHGVSQATVIVGSFSEVGCHLVRARRGTPHLRHTSLMPTQSMTAAVAQRRDPETFRARAITASLAVKDIEKSLAWYRDKIGFYVEEKIQRSGKLAAVALKAGDVRILISQDDGG